jgi:hypothetical protein
MKRNRVFLSDDDEVDVKPLSPTSTKPDIIVEDEFSPLKRNKRRGTIKIDEDSDGADDDVAFPVPKSLTKTPSSVTAINSGSKYETRHSARRSSSRKEQEREAAERELKRLQSGGLDAVLFEEDDEDDYAEKGTEDDEENEDEEDYEEEESEDETTKKRKQRKALSNFNNQAYSKSKNNNYSNAFIARCLKDYDKDGNKEDNRNGIDDDLDDFVVDDDELEEEEMEDAEDRRRRKKRNKKSSRKRKSKIVIEEEENDDEDADSTDSGKIRKRKPKNKQKGQLSSSDEDEEDANDDESGSNDDEEDGDGDESEESVDGNLLYWRFNQMRDSKEEDDSNIPGLLGGIRKVGSPLFCLFCRFLFFPVYLELSFTRSIFLLFGIFRKLFDYKELFSFISSCFCCKTSRKFSMYSS